MKVRAHKKCNICEKIVAFKYPFVGYVTESFYITLRSDDVLYQGVTEKEPIHICENCWLELKLAILRSKNQ